MGMEKIPSMREVWIISGTTQHHFLQNFGETRKRHNLDQATAHQWLTPQTLIDKLHAFCKNRSKLGVLLICENPWVDFY